MKKIRITTLHMSGAVRAFVGCSAVIAIIGILIFIAILDRTPSGRGFIDRRILTDARAKHVAPSSHDFTDSDLRGVNLDHLDGFRCNFGQAHLDHATARGANLSQAYFVLATLTSADLSEANLDSANMSDAQLESANLRGACLRHANLSVANLRGADLRNALLDDIILDQANFDTKTKWPPQFDPTAHGAILRR